MTDLIDTGIEKNETNRSFRASVEKRYITNVWATPGGTVLAGDHLVTNSVGFIASSDSEWLAISGAGKDGKATYKNAVNDIVFTAAPNMTDKVRTATISIRPSSDNWLVLTNITFTQAAGPAGFAVNFEAGGGAGDTSMRVRQNGEKLGELPVVALNGRIFLGWYTAEEGGEAVTADTVVTGDVTYYARWVSLGELNSFTDANGIVWNQILNGGTKEKPVLYAQIIGDGKYPVSGGNIIETGAIDKSVAGALTIPASLGGCPVRSIGPWAFAYCRSLTEVTIPDSVTTIEDCAFASCSKLEKVHFGANVATIGGGAFLYCTSLRMLALPESVADLKASAFGGCESLRYLRAESNFSSGCHIVMGAWMGGMMFNLVSGGIDMDPLWDCTALSCIELGPNVTSVGLDGFGKGPNLRNVICRGMLPAFSGGNTSYGRTTCYVLRENYPDGLPAETWAGMELKYLDGEIPSETAATDFYLANVALGSSAQGAEGKTEFKVGETVLLSYAMSERWSIVDASMQVVNRITVKRISDGSVVGSDDDLIAETSSGSTVERTGIAFDCLAGLSAGSYVAQIDLNTGDAVAETCYANNSTSITFTVTSGGES
ncbi:MAG: leucine-rich repeat protein, partial [Kiritimatiellae bacterium]|nr:leucine-rich repeat protein [Kiritimatiellia bacterium]